MGLGCGAPVPALELRAGEIVLDLGSGGGIDAFLAARLVGPAGRVGRPSRARSGHCAPDHQSGPPVQCARSPSDFAGSRTETRAILQ